MSSFSPTHLTPEQVAAVAAGGGIAHAEDPTTHRTYLLVEQGKAPTLSDDYFRHKVAEGLAEADQGMCEPWDVEIMKAELCHRHADRTTPT